MEHSNKKRKVTAESNTIYLSEESWLDICPDAVSCTDEEFEAFWKCCPSTREKIHIYGKTLDVPRFQKLYGEATYSFSGMKLVPEPEFPPLIQACLEYARSNYPEYNWNGCLANFYPDGNSHISFHQDDEGDLVKGAPILSFSFGAVRDFVVRRKHDNTPVHIREIHLPTTHGSMIAMGGFCQKEYEHAILKATKRDGQVGRRVNLTMRVFKPKKN